ncbi:phage holin family protein [Bacillus sp. B15-48]|uniref:phage holin family protein n=1 Tax=Bacillus sp. B15-48 TaxID=1548601 RepID=UPI00193ECFF8|nr:phage holin family protein [Bacillus sp. B15-48]MBM4762450.1 hypothetical protein [Bacillus sp. B15-48]
MEKLLFSAVALLILVPIIYFLPLGFTFKGKIRILVAALFISLFSAFTAPIFASWQTIVIAVLLISLVSYLMAKKSTNDVEPTEERETEEEELEKRPVQDGFSNEREQMNKDAEIESLVFDMEVQEKNQTLFRTEKEQPTIGELDELHELKFDDKFSVDEAPKVETIESELDEDFWERLMEGDELEILEENREPVGRK